MNYNTNRLVVLLSHISIASKMLTCKQNQNKYKISKTSFVCKTCGETLRPQHIIVSAETYFINTGNVVRIGNIDFISQLINGIEGKEKKLFLKSIRCRFPFITLLFRQYVFSYLHKRLSTCVFKNYYG